MRLADAGAELVGTGADGTEVALPSDAEAGDALNITSETGVALELGLPEGAAGDAVVADDGTVVYDDHVDVDVAVQPTEHGARIQTVLQNANAPTEFTYDVDGLTPALQDDGSVLLLDADGQPAGYVAAPWAFDAAGAPVATSYAIVGSSIVQTVAHNVAGVQYPVVADPSVSVGWRIYVRYSPAEVRSQVTGWRGTVNDKARYAAVLCGAIPNFIGAAACGLIVYDVASSIMSTAKSAAAVGKGMTIEYNYIGGVFPVAWYVS